MHLNKYNVPKHVYRPQRVNTADNKARNLKFLSLVINGMLAGVAFSLGAVAYLSIDSKTLGAAIFSLGLFVIFHYGFGFYTSKFSGFFNQDKQQNLTLIPIWLGNALGAALTALLLFLTRETYAYKLFERANQLSGAKLEGTVINVIVSSIFCGLLMFFAVDIFKNAKSNLQKYLVPLFAIMIFVLCEFDHFVSGTFYFVMADAISIKSIWYIILMTLGNSIGVIIIPLCHKGVKALKEKSNSSI